MSGKTRAIIHLDLDAFYASVEVLENPELEGKPVVVGGRPGQRGVVAAASYPARAYGIHSAMPMARAVALCPNLIALPGRHRLYGDYSRRVMAILREASPLMERMSIDEAYLDLTEQVSHWDEAVDKARELQQRVRSEVGLSASLGVASNKLIAKVASDRDKPGGLTVVLPGEEISFLAPLSVRVLWGVGPVTAQRLAEMQITTVGELALMSEEELLAAFGSHGAHMARQAQGLDSRRVITQHTPKSVGQERTFSRDMNELVALKQQLWKLSQGVGRRLKRTEVAAGTIAIKVRYSDFTTFGRQMSLSVPTDDEVEIYRAALCLFQQAWEPGRPVRLLGVAGRHLAPPTGQLAFW